MTDQHLTSATGSQVDRDAQWGFGKLGLSDADAHSRLIADGPNALPQEARHGFFRILWNVLCEPMFVLLVAAGALYLVMGALGDAVLLLSFVLVVMGITIIQERRTERALEALRQLSTPHAMVIRSGTRRSIPASEVVCGDVILLAEGERVPADALLRQSTYLAADESLLTGEAIPVNKAPSISSRKLDSSGGDGDKLASLFSGTLVTTGQGLAEVVATGSRTELGKIGNALSAVKTERSRLQRETARMVRSLAVFGLALCAVVVVAYALTRGGDAASWKQGFLAGIAMAMAVIPEEFPVILTIFLALGAWRISHSRVLTRRLPAIETLGAATVLCTDKTGTLTRNQMTVSRVIGLRNELSLDIATTTFPRDVSDLLTIAALASRPDPFDPMERAIHLASRQANEAISKDDRADPLIQRTLVRDYPLTSHVLAVTQIWTAVSGELLDVATKGAPEAIVALCGLPPEQQEHWIRQATTLASDGLRVLGVARGRVSADEIPSDQRGLSLEFLGLLALSDPLRDNVPAAVAECQTAGIRVVMITGDYPATARCIARQAGIATDPIVVSGPELARMSDADLAGCIDTVQVFARVVPEQKLRIVTALKAAHEVVAMTGDGVNDAPALKAAHIGIAMGKRGTDVAREAADLVLLDDDFASIVAAVKLGRRIFDNIKKAIAFTFAVHVPIAGLSILPVFVDGWPLLLLPIHIVFLELVIDPSCTLIFEAEPADDDIMRRPPRDPSERLYAWKNIALSLLQGASVLIVCIGIFLIIKIDHREGAVRGLIFTTVVVSCIAIIITNRSWTRNLWATLQTPNPPQWWVIFGSIGFLTLALNVPIVQQLFHFAPVRGWDVLACIIAGTLCVGWFEGLKYLHRLRSRKAVLFSVVPHLASR